MIYEWYSGSDTSTKVPRAIAKLISERNAVEGDPAIRVLRELLKIEQEPNWRGYMLWRIGVEQLAEDRGVPGIATLLEARKQFDPLLATMRDVVAEYCDTLFALLGHYYDEGDMETIAAMSASIAANLGDAKLSISQETLLYFYQGFAFEMLARKHSLQFLHPLALASYLKWHRLAPDEPACLEHLAYSYFYNGDGERSIISARMCLDVAPQGEIRERVETFLKDHAHELLGRELGS